MAPLPVNTPLADYRERLAEPSDIKDELPLLLEHAASYPAVRVLELGVRTGRSTSAFLAAAAQAGGHVWSVDCEPPQVPAWWHHSRRWTFLQADDMEVAPELLGPRWASSFHVLFIDTSHRYDHTLAELRRFVPYVAPGGVVLAHDTKLPGRMVASALDDFCAEYPHLSRELPWQPGKMITPAGPVTWAERGGRYGLGVIVNPNGPAGV